MFCINCGKQVIDGARFCTFCGTKVMEIMNGVESAKPIEEPVVVVTQEQTPAELYVLGLKKESEGDSAEALILFQQAAEKGHSAAQAKLKREVNWTAASVGAIAGTTNLGMPTIAEPVVIVNNSSGIASTVLNSAEAARVADIGARFANGLENLNTARGGGGGLKGFVGEHMQAAQASLDGKMTYVINNNGSADLVYIGKNGHKYYQQMKIGPSHTHKNINFEQYKGQTLVVDKGNPNFKKIKAEGAKHGVKVIEGNLTNEEVEMLSKLMKKETAFRGTKTATIVPKVYSAHKAGLQSAKSGALYGGGFSLGSNLVDVACGDKKVGEAAGDIAKDTAVSYAAGYAAGAVGSAVASTSAGAAVISAAGSVGSAVASTTVGGAAIAGATATTAAIGAAGTAATTAVVGAASTVGAAVGSAAVAATAGTAIGSTVAAGVATTAAAGAAVGAAAVAAAPVVAVGAALGVGYKLLKKLF